jgi:predicted transcriptional regulator of viral defense system
MTTLKDYITAIRRKGYLAFTIEQIVKDLEISAAAARLKCKRLKDKGELSTPVKGLYVILPPEHQQMGSLPAEELIPIVMNHLTIDYYACLLTAASYHGASHQKPQIFQIMLSKRMRGIAAGKINIKLCFKKSLHNLPLQNFITKTGYLKIASPELTMMDLFLYPHLVGGLNNIATILSELVGQIDATKMIQLIKQTKQKIWVQRLGYMLEKVQPLDNGHMPTLNKLVNCLRSYIASQKLSYIPLSPEVPTKGCLRDTSWRIIVNTTIEAD